MKYILKRCLSVILALILLLTMLPEETYASGYSSYTPVEENYNTSDDVDVSEETDEDEAECDELTDFGNVFNDSDVEPDSYQDEDIIEESIEETNDNVIQDETEAEDSEFHELPEVSEYDEDEVPALEDLEKSGTWGENITWSFDVETGTLTLEGEGDMYRNGSIDFPWESLSRYYTEKVVISPGITNIAEYAFEYSSCSEIVFPDGLTSIGTFSIAHSNVESIYLPDSVTQLSYRAFGSCKELKYIRLSPNIVFDVINDTDIFRSCTSLEKFEIPYGIDLIPARCFYRCTGLTTIVIPESVTSIGGSAFSECTSLSTIDIPRSVTSIGGGAFSECTGLTTIDIPGSVTSIGDLAFRECTSLTTINIPGSVTSIGDRAFADCKGLTNIAIPGNVTSLGMGVLVGCEKLINIQYSGTQEDLYKPIMISSNADTDVLWNHIENNKIIASGKCNEDISWSLYELGGLRIYGTGYMPDYSKTSPAPWDKYKNDIYGVSIAPSVSSIGAYSFYGYKNLYSAHIECLDINIGEYAFGGCDSFGGIFSLYSGEEFMNDANIAIGNDVIKKEIISYIRVADNSGKCGDNVNWCIDKHRRILVLYGTGDMYDYTTAGNNMNPWLLNNLDGFDTVIIEHGITSVGNWAFYYLNNFIKNIYVSGSVQKIKCGAFSYIRGGLENIFLNEGIQILEDKVLFSAGIESIVLPDSVTEIGYRSFFNCCNLKSITLSENLTYIGQEAFYDVAALTTVLNGNNVETIGERAFCSCDYLETVDIGENLKTIQNYAFFGCINLSTFVLPESVNTIGDYAFCKSNLTSVTLPSGLTNMGNNVFENCTNLEKVIVSDGVFKIGDAAFKWCNNLSTVSLPESLKTIGGSAFYGCNNLRTLILPESLTTIGDSAFEECENLSDISLPESLTSIGNKAFEGCKSLSIVILPEKLTKISNSTFERCENLNTVYLPEDLTSIGDYAFKNCYELTGIELPSGLKTIGKDVFVGCKKLVQIVLPVSLTSIGANVFSGCDNIREILYPGNQEKWNEISVNGDNDVLFAKLVIDAVTFVYEERTKTLRIYGKGNMTDYSNETEVPWYSYRNSIENVVFESGLTGIGSYAFYGLDVLKSIEIPETVTTIGSNAFGHCDNLEKVVFDGVIESFPIRMFVDCIGLKSFTIPEGTKTISAYCFYGCSNLEDIYIPTSVTNIYAGAFYDCNNLKHVYYAGNAEQWKNVNITTNSNLVEFLTCEISENVWWEYDEESRTLYVNGSGDMPNYSKDNRPPWYSLGENARHVEIGKGITSIGDYAFSGFDNSRFTQIFIPEGVEYIGTHAFGGCDSLKAVYIPASVKYIAADFITKSFTNIHTQIHYAGSLDQFNEIICGDENFDDYNIELIPNDDYIEKGVISENIEWSIDTEGKLLISGTGNIPGCSGVRNAPWSIHDYQIKNVVIEEGITGIGFNALAGLYLAASISLPDSLEELGTGVFSGCTALERITIPEGVKKLPSEAFKGDTALVKVILPKELEEIGSKAFSGCSGLLYVSVPETVELIDEYAWENCSSLGSISLVCNVQTLNKGLFFGCSELVTVTLGKSITRISDNAFLDCNKLTYVIYKGNINEYRNINVSDNGNTKFISAQVTADTIIYSGNLGTKIKWTFTDDGVLTISGKGAMKNFTGDYGTNPIPWKDFRTDIKSVVVEKGITSLGDYSFYNCTALTNVDIASSVTKIGAYCFSCCDQLKAVSVPSGVTTIGKAAFSNCRNLADININCKITVISESLFENCVGITSFTIPGKVKTIDAGAFSRCTGLTSVVMTKTTTTVKDNAFYSNNSLKDVYYYGSDANWNKIKFGVGNERFTQTATVHLGSKNSYEVVFDPNGGEGTMASQFFFNGEEKELSAVSFARTGYVFKGWKFGKKIYSDKEKVKKLSTKNGAVVTLVAQWEADTNFAGYEYTVTYKFSGGYTGSVPSKTVHVGEKFTIEDYDRPCYRLVGWAIEENGEVVYKPYEEVSDINIALNSSPANKVTLYSVFEADTFKVNYNGNGGKTSDGKTIFSEVLNIRPYSYYPANFMADNRFVRAGYTFMGWARSPKAASPSLMEGSLEPNLATDISSDVNYYAVWRPNEYTLNFKKGNAKATGKMESVTVKYNETLKLPANMFKYPGYSFTGWKCSNGKTYKDLASVKNMVTEDGKVLTLTAIWSKNTYTVKFNANGGKGTSPATLTGDGDVTPIIIPENPYTFAGYTFMGWNTAANGTGKTYKPNDSVIFETRNKATVTLYPIWEYDITINPGTGSGTEGTYKLHYNHAETIDNSFSLQGYYIAGWNKNESKAKSGTVQYKANAVKNVGTGVTLYAVWKPVTYTVVFDANGGTGKMKNQKLTYNKSAALTSNSYKRTGYTFAGWSDTPDGEVKYANKNKAVYNLSETLEGTVTLYAKWTPVKYTITYVLPKGATNAESNPKTYTIEDTYNGLTLADPSKPGYTFKGWYKNTFYTKKMTGIPEGSCKNIKVYAKFVK